ncbi:MAG TPA: hypothetical protein VLL95_04515 [Phnomibacter sp.]|nr:hypothetical protein [Phnomibacter sp.]
MNEGEIVEEFHGAGYLPGIFLYFFNQLVAHQNHQWPYSFSTEGKKIAIGIVQACRLCRKMILGESLGKLAGKLLETLHRMLAVGFTGLSGFQNRWCKIGENGSSSFFWTNCTQSY